MNYKSEMKAGKLNVLSPTIGMYVMKDATMGDEMIVYQKPVVTYDARYKETYQ